ncbi:MAG TPA: signal peptide peptidase SppA [Candidatus Binatia bacterium]|nr:signal peptide peptidase SppA [Candidatus Binatia bacterium]
MARRHPILRGLAILTTVVLALIGAAVVAGALFGGGEGSVGGRFPFGKTVTVVELRGVIDEASGTEVVATLERARRADGTVAVVVRIDSPGGSVAPAQEIYDAIWRVRAVKPVVASLGTIAASAGYYIASAANVVVADAGTLTGSLGVIMEVPQYRTLAEKVGVGEEVVKSGPFKDVGHPLRPLAPEERALLQAMIDDVLGQFVDAVARGRGLDVDKVRALADGRVFSGAQAHAAGLVDELGGLDDATRIAWARAGQEGEPRVVRARVHRRAWWIELLDRTLLESAGGPTRVAGFVSLYRGVLPE